MVLYECEYIDSDGWMDTFPLSYTCLLFLPLGELVDLLYETRYGDISPSGSTEYTSRVDYVVVVRG